MKSITIHGLEDELDKGIRSKAEKEGRSLNKTIKQLLKEALGLIDQPRDHRQDFLDLCGVWSKSDLHDFERATEDLRSIDPEDWK